jgi:inner membrane protein involved in colicin E2 resistance
MLAKRILAGIFVGIILLKLLVGLTNPHKWLDLTGVLLGHHLIVTGIYLILLIITGYYIFSSLKLIDIAVVMFFTSLLVGLSLVPYAPLLLKMSEEIAARGLGKAWLALVLWGALAVAVLYEVLSKRRGWNK